jgi:hypothetical protein
VGEEYGTAAKAADPLVDSNNPEIRANGSNFLFI